MKKFYIRDNNGKFASEDNSVRFTLLQGEELYTYLNSDEGNGKEFDVSIDDNGDEIGIELPPHLIKSRKKEKNHQDYLKTLEAKSNITIVSFDMETEGQDGEPMSLYEIIANESDVASEVMHKMRLDALHKALQSLSAEEYKIIQVFFLTNEPMTEDEYATIFGATQQAINKRKRKILAKIKKNIEKCGC